MTDFDYKKYSLKNLENWMHDAMSAGEATPKEIYDVIVGVVKENYYTYKQKTSEAYELLALLNSGIDSNKYQDYLNGVLSCDKDDPSPECKGAWDDFWTKTDVEGPPVYVSEDGDVFVHDYCNTKEDKVVKWQLPVQVDGLTGECYIELPDDLLEVAELNEGDTVEWIDRGDGSFEMRKVNGPE
jgi:hypothetical protein